MMGWYRNFVTLGPVGYLPASGTMATLCTIPLVYVLTMFPCYIQATSIVLLLLISLYMLRQILSGFKQSDPREIVIDEVIGFLVALYGFAPNPLLIILGFCLFRIF